MDLRELGFLASSTPRSQHVDPLLENGVRLCVELKKCDDAICQQQQPLILVIVASLFILSCV